MCFNLLPAYPLDGGHTLDAWLGAVLGGQWATRIVACLGLVVAVGIAYLAFPNAIFLMLVALVIGHGQLAGVAESGAVAISAAREFRPTLTSSFSPQRTP